ncbi:ATP translocase [Halieaceae bacterium IMCC14734]|uniref:ADP,ATP carrier protein n=1 Tax=Candidatus Litorirhabdus singularis TaxID=2518993 RepID=A0ABT3TIG9_9GAMM|nr:ATP translocase [Candidatus Litorirhabdus singularis]MCX2982071.1 ATP translocase [Candidatus Litorirhabdus singularis]
MQSFSASERILSLFTTLRPGEGRSALLLGAQSFVIMFSYYLLKVIRDPLILAEGNPELKAYTNAMQAVILMLVVPVFAKIYQHQAANQPQHLLVQRILLFFIGNMVLFGLAYNAGWRIAIAYYVWLGIFSVMAVALFWSFAADLYNVKSGQRLFPVIAAAASAGAYLGASFAGMWDPMVGHGGTIYTAAVLLMLPCWLSSLVAPTVPAGSGSSFAGSAQSGEEKEDEHTSLAEGFLVVLRSRYLILIAVFVIIMNLINTNGEFILSAFVSQAADASFGLPAQAAERDAFITRFYSSYFAWFNLLGFFVQLFLVARIFDKVGLRGAILILPALMILSYSAMLIFPLLAVVRVSMIAENSLSYSLQNTTRHALFLPLSRKEKYVGKQSIDTFFFRFGDLLSAGAVFIGSSLLGLQLSGFVIANIGLAAGLFWISWVIGKQNQGVVEALIINAPPILAVPIPDQHIAAGEPYDLTLPAGTFLDPDEGDALKFQAYGQARGQLPSWVRFDTMRGHFRLAPPAGSSGALILMVVATDFDGLEAEAEFTLYYGDMSEA